MDLHAGSGCLGQAPLAAAAPVAVVGVGGAYGRAHGGHLADARLKGSAAGHVDGHRQVDQGDRRQHRRHLANAYRAAYAAVLGRHH